MTNPDFPMTVTEEEDGSFTIEWDQNHPVTSYFNNFTEEDFVNMIMDACKKVLGKEEL